MARTMTKTLLVSRFHIIFEIYVYASYIRRQGSFYQEQDWLEQDSYVLVLT